MAYRPILALLAMGIAALPWLAEAGDPAPFGDTLTGDWGGWRTRLANDGIDFNLGWTTESAANVQGGSQQGVRYTDQWTFGATLDLNKLLNLHDAHFQVTITDRNGRNLSSDEHLDSLQQVQADLAHHAALVRPSLFQQHDRLEDRPAYRRRGFCQLLLRF